MRCAGLFLFFQCSAFAFSSCVITQDPEHFIKHAAHIPDTIAQSWINDNADLLTYLARMPYPLSTWQDKYANGNWHLFKLGIKNNGYTNFIFQIPESNYWVQIAGSKHRVRNLYTYNTRQNSYWYTEIAKHWEFRNSMLLDQLEIVPTYQTISRFAYYLLLEEAIHLFECSHVRIAPTYLVHIADFSSIMSDEHYIVVQEHIPNILRLKVYPHRIHNVSNEALTELFNVICATGYWNIKNGLYVDQDNKLVLLDYEQRNIENPEDFFFKDIQSFEACVFNGIKELAVLHLKPYCLHKYNQILSLIASHKNLPHMSIWPKCRELLEVH